VDERAAEQKNGDGGYPVTVTRPDVECRLG
jgi:hypothetical protein